MNRWNKPKIWKGVEVDEHWMYETGLAVKGGGSNGMSVCY